MKKIAIIGGGYTGLAVGKRLLDEGYENIKITTLDDLDYGEYLIKKRKENN